jgi:hypothetical protein
MDTLGIKKTRNIGLIIKENALIRFLLVFTFSMIILQCVGPLVSGVSSCYKSIFKSFSASFNKSNAGSRFINITEDAQNPESVQFEIQFTDRRSQSGEIPVRVIATDFRREAYLPFALLIALFVALPVSMKKKYKKILLGSLIVNIYIFFKVFAFIFDNYNSPELSIAKLPPVVEQAVYLFNGFVNMTGFSTTLVVPIIIWFAISYDEIIEIAMKIGKS